MEGYIKKIEEQGNVTILEVHVWADQPDGCIDQQDFSTENDYMIAEATYQKKKNEYNTLIKAIGSLHLGLVDIKQED